MSYAVKWSWFTLADNPTSTESVANVASFRYDRDVTLDVPEMGRVMWSNVYELGRLVEAELIYQRGLPPQAMYTFKHALIQDTAYESLLRSTKQGYHQRIVAVLEERFPETAEHQPELLAHHYTEAGLNEEAVRYWQRAGQRASERSAHAETIGHLTKGIALLVTLPETAERHRHELTMQTMLGLAFFASKGQGVPEVEHTFTRARELSPHVGDSNQLFQVLLGLRRYYFNHAELRTTHELDDQLLHLAQQTQDPAQLLEAHRVQGSTLFTLGDLNASLDHLEQGYQPSLANVRAVAFPIPEAPPVTSATLPSSVPGMWWAP